MILTHPGLTKLTFMDYLLTMLRNWLRRKLSYDKGAVSPVHTPPTHGARCPAQNLFWIRGIDVTEA